MPLALIDEDADYFSETTPVRPRTPLPESMFNGTFHGKNVEVNVGPFRVAGYRSESPGAEGAKEPNVAPGNMDPWDLARRLGIADNSSYPIPNDLRHVNLSKQSASDAFAKAKVACIATRTLATCTLKTQYKSAAPIATAVTLKRLTNVALTFNLRWQVPGEHRPIPCDPIHCSITSRPSLFDS